jgi:hypothetical protein
MERMSQVRTPGFDTTSNVAESGGSHCNTHHLLNLHLERTRVNRHRVLNEDPNGRECFQSIELSHVGQKI